MQAEGVILRSPRRDGSSRRGSVQHELPHLGLRRKLVAEAIGAFFLTFVAGGGEVMASVTNGEVSNVAKALAPGLVVMALVYSLGDVSGAQFNPAVTLAFSLRRVFRWREVPAYWITQLSAAVAAAVVLRVMFGNAARVGAPQVKYGVVTGLVTEILLTCLLVTVILNTATRARVLGPNAAIAVGATIGLCGLVAGPVSGASMNPARSLGPALVASYSAEWWVYLVGSIVGAVITVILTNAVHPVRDREEVAAAEGEDGGSRHMGIILSRKASSNQ
jgi:aquaporin Z